MDSPPGARLENADAAARRGPVAVATAISVIFAGAAFLIFAAAQKPPPAAIEPNTGLENNIGARDEASALVHRPNAVQPAIASDAVEAPPATTMTAKETPNEIAEKKVAAVSPKDAAGQPDDNDSLTPRLKPAPKKSSDDRAMAHAVTPTVMSLGQLFAAGPEDRPEPFFFQADAIRDASPRAPLAIELAGDANDGPQTFSIILQKGETFVDAMRRAGVRANDRNAAAYAFGEYQNLRKLRPGQEFILTTSTPNQTLFQLVAGGEDQQAYLLALEFKPEATTKITLKREADGGYTGEKSILELTTRLASMNGRIGGSLFMSAKHVGAPDEIIADFANIFAYDVDFQREIFGGDEFEAIFEVKYDEDGRVVGSGEILFARLKWRGRTKEKEYYRFATAKDGGRADYFDAAGQSAKRLLMKTPIDGARLSSGFGTRKHPILGYARAHKGVDFAAPRGTPVKAAGDGVVERANRYGSFGNYVRIRHANGYKTAYAHLNGFARGIRAGKRVRQGDIIAYVGTTGRSTGPHLHYEVHHNGVAVNPQRLKIATGVKLKGAELERFRIERDRIDAMRLKPASDGPALLAQDAGDETQL